LNEDRGKTVPPGITTKVGPITPDVDTPAEKALPPGIELNLDRGKALPPGIESKVGPVTPQRRYAGRESLETSPVIQIRRLTQAPYKAFFEL
jgi:hypothetical protein